MTPATQTPSSGNKQKLQSAENTDLEILQERDFLFMIAQTFLGPHSHTLTWVIIDGSVITS